MTKQIVLLMDYMEQENKERYLKNVDNKFEQLYEGDPVKYDKTQYEYVQLKESEIKFSSVDLLIVGMNEQLELEHLSIGQEIATTYYSIYEEFNILLDFYTIIAKNYEDNFVVLEKLIGSEMVWEEDEEETMIIEETINHDHVINYESKNEYYVIQGTCIGDDYRYDLNNSFTTYEEALALYHSIQLTKLYEFKEIMYSPVDENEENESIRCLKLLPKKGE